MRTYQYLYSGPDDEEGTVLFDKATFHITQGDGIEFLNFGFSLEDPAKDQWFYTGDGLVFFIQEPVFQLEFLDFDDKYGEPVDYYYALWAEDASGNATLGELVPSERVADSPTPEPTAGPSTDPVGTPGDVFGSLIPELMEEWGIPGGAVAIVRDGKLVMARGYGMADVEGNEPVRPNSLFRIASISKPVTAVAILKLVQDGHLIWTIGFSRLSIRSRFSRKKSRIQGLTTLR